MLLLAFVMEWIWASRALLLMTLVALGLVLVARTPPSVFSLSNVI